MLPTTKIRTRYVHLQDGRKFALTESGYLKLRDDKDNEKSTKIFELNDVDTGDLLFEGEYRAIKEFSMISKGKVINTGWFCGYGNIHEIQGACNCFEKYKVTESAFRAKAFEIYGKKTISTKLIGAEEIQRGEWTTMYMQDLKYSERNNIIALCK